MRAGAVVFALGAAALLAVLVPFFLGAHDLPTWLDLGTLLLPVGLGLALVGLLRGARQQ